MALLHQPIVHHTVLDSREKVARLIAGFYALLARPATSVSVTNPLTMDQIFWQVGVRLPIAHFAGFHLVPRTSRKVAPEALLFRIKFPVLAHTFLRVVKLQALLDVPEISP